MPVDDGWHRRTSPTLETFEALVTSAFARLPESFKALCGDLVMHVEDFPDDDTLDEMECESEFDLLGLFRGHGLAQREATTGQMPNMIWLYRRPILDYWAANDEPLGAIVTHVLIHEIGHHFGFSDADMEKIEAAPE